VGEVGAPCDWEPSTTESPESPTRVENWPFGQEIQ
jgi:hypothetical protein